MASDLKLISFFPTVIVKRWTSLLPFSHTHLPLINILNLIFGSDNTAKLFYAWHLVSPFKYNRRVFIRKFFKIAEMSRNRWGELKRKRIENFSGYCLSSGMNFQCSMIYFAEFSERTSFIGFWIEELCIWTLECRSIDVLFCYWLRCTRRN